MKSLYISFITILLFLSCEEDASLIPKKYPVVKTNIVSNITEDGATFSAEILEQGSQKITEYGFLMETKIEGQTLKYSYLASDPIRNNAFQFRCDKNILPQVNYKVKAYVKTTYYTSIGNLVSFFGKGAKAPEILGFNPKSGPDGTIVILYAKFFNNSYDYNRVDIGYNSCKVIAVNGDSIIFVIPSTSLIGKTHIKVSNGSGESVADTPFNILGPIINSITPSIGNTSTVVSLKGERLMQNGNTLSVYMGAHNVEIISKSDTLIEILPPNLMMKENKTFSIALSNGSKTIFKENAFVLSKL